MHWVASDGSILRVNQAELDLLGYTREEYVGRHIADFHADPPVIQDILARLTRGERLDKYEARLKAKDDSVKHVLISSNVQFREGQFINTRCFTLDVTDLKKSEQALRESERRLRRGGARDALPLQGIMRQKCHSLVETRLPGWACRTRTQESVREPCT